jgi:hypothetical protein
MQADYDSHCLALLWAALNAGKRFRPNEFLSHVGYFDHSPVHIWIDPIAGRLVRRKACDALDFRIGFLEPGEPSGKGVQTEIS